VSASDELLGALGPVVNAFDQLGVAWYVGGSVASGAFGEFRATNDVDVIADLRLEHAEPLVDALGAAYYADLESIRSAIRRRASFNAVHFDTMLKIDVFVLRARAYDQEALRRRVTRRAGTDEDAPSLSLASPEDVVLAKLDWDLQGERHVGGAVERRPGRPARPVHGDRPGLSPRVVGRARTERAPRARPRRGRPRLRRATHGVPAGEGSVATMSVARSRVVRSQRPGVIGEGRGALRQPGRVELEMGLMRVPTTLTHGPHRGRPSCVGPYATSP